MGSYVDAEVLNVDLRKERTNMKVSKDFLKNLSECDSFEDRIRMIQSQWPCDWLSTPAETLGKYQKNACASQALRVRGNGKFKTKNFEDALECYNLAVMFAKTEKELGLNYANRSAVLVEMQDYEGALKDIELALSHDYPEALAYKLEDRRSKCNDLILKRNEDDIHKKVLAEVEKRKQFREEMLKIETNPLIPSAASCVKIKHDDVIGRHLIVDQEVPAGTVLVVENPYAAILRDEVSWETKNCHYCLKKIRRGIPCDVCVFVLYCDQECKLKADQEFHQWECRCLPQLHCNTVSNGILLAFRIICKVGPEELAHLFLTRDQRFFQQSGPYGTEENCVYESDAYLSIYHLQTTSKHLDAPKLYNNSLLALLWTDILETKTYFFNIVRGLLASTPVGHQGLPKLVKEFKDFVAAVMLRHIESVPVNVWAIAEMAGLENLPLSSFYNGELSQFAMFQKREDNELPLHGYGIFPVFSMMTHSCDGNIMRINDVSGGTVIAIAKRRLKAGETLFTNYGMHYTCNSKGYRQSYLRKRFHFKCQCVACELDWPLLRNMDSEMRFCCPSCSEKDRGGYREQEKYQLAEPNWKCGGCGKLYIEEDLKAKFDSNAEKLKTIVQSVCHKDPCDAMKRLIEIIEYFQYHVCSPTREDHYGQMAFLTKAVALILRYAESFY